MTVGWANRSWIGVILASLLLLAGAFPGASASQTSTAVAPIEDVSTPRLEFPQGIRIGAELQIEGMPADTWLTLVYRVGDNPTLYMAETEVLEPTDGGRRAAEAWLDLQAQFIPPGVEITYEWRLMGPGGVVAASSPRTTSWLDDRWAWQHLDGTHVRLHHHGLEEAFASEVLSAADQTVETMLERFSLAPTSPVALWVYPSQDAFREAMIPNSRETMVAATYPEFAVMLAVVPDGSESELWRVVPHELAHIVLFQASNNPFTYLPLWFNEGVATHIQTGGTDGYPGMVTAAWERDDLYALASIDVSFPYTAYEATLAYAVSWSAVDYLLRTYGDEGITRLVQAYATGLPWAEAMVEGLGVTQEAFEAGWRAWIADAALGRAA